MFDILEHFVLSTVHDIQCQRSKESMKYSREAELNQVLVFTSCINKIKIVGSFTPSVFFIMVSKINIDIF